MVFLDRVRNAFNGKNVDSGVGGKEYFHMWKDTIEFMILGILLSLVFRLFAKILNFGNACALEEKKRFEEDKPLYEEGLKRCPACKMVLPIDATKCPYCQQYQLLPNYDLKIKLGKFLSKFSKFCKLLAHIILIYFTVRALVGIFTGKGPW